MSGLGLSELFDLESLVLKEKGEPEEVRRTRYRNLGRRALDQGISPDDSAALLKSLVAPDRRSPGARFEAALGWFHTLVALTGMICGGAISLGLLHEAGSQPVNVLNFLAALVGVQIVLLLLLLVALIPRRRRPAGSLTQAFLMRGLHRLLTRFMPETDPRLLQDLVGRLDAHMGLTRWLLVRAAQIFGVSFNIAALAACLYRIAFTDVAFAWSTTLHVDASDLRRLLETLASPWTWVYPGGLPSRQMVEMTQYSHLEGKYLLRAAGERSVDPRLLGGWWRFLLLSITTYGFLPRLLVLATAEVRIRRILRDTPSRNEEFRRLADWMRLPVVTTSAEGQAASPSATPEGPTGEDPALPPPGSSCEIVLDGAHSIQREDLDKKVKDRFGWTVSAVLSPKDLHQAAGSSDTPLLVVVSAWEEPTKGNQRPFQGLPKGRLIVVGLVNSSSNGGDDPRLAKIRERWKRHLRSAQQDLRLRVEALG